MSISFDGIRHFLLQPIESFGISFLFGLDRSSNPFQAVGCDPANSLKEGERYEG
jgi:hypothetical protein